MADSIIRFEKYFDENYGRAYFFDKKTGDSIWELPKGADEEKEVLDCTIGPQKDELQTIDAEATAVRPNQTKVSEESKKEDDDSNKELKDYQAHMSAVERMEREALE